MRQGRQALLATGKSYDLEFRIRRRDGGERIIRTRGELRRGGLDGEPASGLQGKRRLVGTVQDVTEQKQAEEARRASEERFMSFMDHLPAMAFIKDRESRIVYLNQYNKEFFGWDDSIVNQPASYLMDPDKVDGMIADDQVVLGGGRIVNVQTEMG